MHCTGTPSWDKNAFLQLRTPSSQDSLRQEPPATSLTCHISVHPINVEDDFADTVDEANSMVLARHEERCRQEPKTSSSRGMRNVITLNKCLSYQYWFPLFFGSHDESQNRLKRRRESH